MLDVYLCLGCGGVCGECVVGVGLGPVSGRVGGNNYVCVSCES